MYLKGKFGIEVESLLFDEDLKANDFELNDLYQEIILDYAANQVEVVPLLSDNIEALVGDLNFYFDYLDEEYNVWPLSVPPSSIFEYRLANLDKESFEYRKYLQTKYSNSLLLQSGIHYNLSFDDSLLRRLYKMENSKLEFNDFKSEKYFKVFKNLNALLPLIIYMNSHSPYVDVTFESDELNTYGNVKGLDYSMSIRNSYKYGYANKDLELDFESLESFKNSLNNAVKKGVITSYKEDYSKLRLKSKKGNIIDNNIDYIEIRCIDLNPFVSLIDETELIFMHALAVSSLFDDFFITHKDVILNVDKIALEGLKDDVKVIIDNEEVDFRTYFINYLSKLLGEDYLSEEYKNIIRDKISLLNNAKNTSAYSIRSIIDKDMHSLESFVNKVKVG